MRLCIIGVGLIGGSLARAARARNLADHITGADTNPENLARAVQLGVLDDGCADPAAAAARADLVVISAPVGSAEPILRSLRAAWSETAVYTDVGSTKCSFLSAARATWNRIPANLVPGHPIAGAERSGVEAARPDLFEGRRVILTPVPETDPAALGRVEALWTGIGAQVSRMSAEHHDEILAATSHLPHVLAFVLTEMLGRQDEQQEIFRYAAGGFRDFTRIASSDPRMWRDICLANREAIRPLLAQYRQAVGAAEEWLAAGDGAALHTLFTRARDARQRFLDQSEK